MSRRSITPAYITANGLWNPFTESKKFRIQCGSCDYEFNSTVLCSTSDIAQCVCPICDNNNKFSISVFMKQYENYLNEISERDKAFEDAIKENRSEKWRNFLSTIKSWFKN